MSLQIKVELPSGCTAHIAVPITSIGAVTANPAHNTDIIQRFSSNVINNIIGGAISESTTTIAPVSPATSSARSSTIAPSQSDRDSEGAITVTDISQVDEESRIQVFVKTWSGQTRTIQASRHETVSQFMERIQDKEGIPPKLQRLLLAGRQLSSKESLAACGVRNESTLYLLSRLPGS